MTNPYLYAGFSHVRLSEEAYDLGEGLRLKRTFAHLMAPRLMAFSRAEEGRPHPGPWRAARGGRGFDVEVELRVPTDAPLASGWSADETVWWIAALLRLARFPYLTVPVLSDHAFSEAAHSEKEPLLRPFEEEPRIFVPPETGGNELRDSDLEWVKVVWKPGAELMQRNPRFRQAIKVFDTCTVRGRTAGSLLAVWAGLEQLFSTAGGELRYRVSSNIAAFLEPAGPKRLSLFKEVLGLYNHRSTAAHSAADIETGPLINSYVIMRNALVKMIDQGEVPSQRIFEELIFCAGQPDQSVLRD